MISHNKRYMVVLHEWGRKPIYGSIRKDDYKDFLRVSRNECDSLNEIEETISLINELFEGITRPDILSNIKIDAKSSKDNKRYYDKSSELRKYIYDETHFFWGYAVFDFDTEKIISFGGQGLHEHPNPTKSLGLYDIYFRKDGEVPKNYKWDNGEYQGWLQYRWGDGKNAITNINTEPDIKVISDKPIKKKKPSKFAKPMTEEELEELLNYNNDGVLSC